MTVLVVAGVSARVPAEAAAHDGHDVVVLDLFGDADTLRAAIDWQPIGKAGSLQIDPRRFLTALQAVARQQGDALVGWIPGGGLEGHPDLIDAAAPVLPLIGTPADGVRGVRDPRRFFTALAAHGIAHPPVRFEAPPDRAGWLLKDARGCGGWHIRHADASPGRGQSPQADASVYFQQVQPGLPMSGTFIANGEQALLVGVNELLTQAIGVHPHVHGGCIGPVPVSHALRRQVQHAASRLSASFGLRGWCSIDFLCRDDAISVLEVNPRWPASLALYGPGGVIEAQLKACLHGTLPRPGAFESAWVRGTAVVYADHAFALGDAAARHLANRSDVHDVPHAGATFAAGEPVCSLSAAGDTVDNVRLALAGAREALMPTLENPR